jgi:hypothetical protein
VTADHVTQPVEGVQPVADDYEVGEVLMVKTFQPQFPHRSPYDVLRLAPPHRGQTLDALLKSGVLHPIEGEEDRFWTDRTDLRPT